MYETMQIFKLTELAVSYTCMHLLIPYNIPTDY